MLTYFLHSDKKDEWYWTVIETGREKDRTVARSADTYSTKEECEKDVYLMKTSSATAPIKQIWDPTLKVSSR